MTDPVNQCNFPVRRTLRLEMECDLNDFPENQPADWNKVRRIWIIIRVVDPDIGPDDGTGPQKRKNLVRVNDSTRRTRS